MKRRFFLAVAGICLGACGAPSSELTDTQTQLEEQAAQMTAETGEGVTIYVASKVITMDGRGTTAEAVAVSGSGVLATGSLDDMAVLGAATIDRTFEDKVIVPGLIDPHVHVMLGSLQYNLPLTPPWPMATPQGMVAGLGTRDAFLAKVSDYDAATPPGQPLVIYGYHNLVHGDLTRADLDAITTTRPLAIWHYSSHDFYLNSAAIARGKFTPALAETYHGVDLDSDGELTGRIYEDAALEVLGVFGDVILAPDNVTAGFEGFSQMLRDAGVTTTAEMGYGIFGWEMENANIAANWQSPEAAGYHLYLVPEFRALQRTFGDDRVAAVQDMVSGARAAPAPVLPRVKFFTDAAYYSQTMRLSSPGYLTGQSAGNEGLWVTQPDDIVPAITPYWQAGLGVNIHSNGDAAQTATLAAAGALMADRKGSFTIEHGGLFSPEQVAQAGQLGLNVSAASHYVYYLSGAYEGPLGPARANWISPLGALSEAGVAVTLHSDAPLAPPSPLLAAGVHITRTTREGPAYAAEMALTRQDALEAITIDAARALGLEAEIGSIEFGKRADFTILDASPLDTSGEDWADIGVWGVVLAGKKRRLD